MPNTLAFVGVGVVGIVGSIAAWYVARLGNSVLRDEFQRSIRELHLKLLNDISAEYEGRKQADFDTRDYAYHAAEKIGDDLREHVIATSSDFTRDEQKQVGAQQAEYERVMSEQAASTPPIVPASRGDVRKEMRIAASAADAVLPKTTQEEMAARSGLIGVGQIPLRTVKET
jgi:hypothetical protein